MNSGTLLYDNEMFTILVYCTFVCQIVSDKTLYLKWDDSHESTYNLQWLRERNFDEGQEHWQYRQVKWTGESFATIFRSFEYEDVIKRL